MGKFGDDWCIIVATNLIANTQKPVITMTFRAEGNKEKV